MKCQIWANKIFVGGGFLRSIVAGEPVNDVDVFVTDKNAALALAREINCAHFGIDAFLTLNGDDARRLNRFVETDNAYTITHTKPSIQIIHRWTFDSAQAVSDSFDFTCCCAAFWYSWTKPDNGHWESVCDPLFYPDVAAKRLVYRKPARNEDAGGSMLRVLKYYQKGYRIPLDSLAAVIARLVSGAAVMSEVRLTQIITGLLREVDPAIDPDHIAHLPSSTTDEIVSVDDGETRG